MTTASELFCNRRSRFGRNSVDLGLDSAPDRSFHHHGDSNRRRHHYHHQNHSYSNNGTRRDRHDLDGCDPLRRPPLIRHQSHRPPNSERDTVRLDEGSSQSSLGNIISLDNFGGTRNNLRISRNDRLPGAVLLARERLLERLRGVSLSGNRRRNRASSGVIRSDPAFGDDSRLVDAGDWETEISQEWLYVGTPHNNSISRTDQLLVPQETSKRPPGLTQEAVNCLQIEVFSKTECNEVSRAAQECSICLETFMEGAELIRLPCTHRFHSSCLDPWVRICGDCPCCRRGIVITSHME